MLNNQIHLDGRAAHLRGRARQHAAFQILGIELEPFLGFVFLDRSLQTLYIFGSAFTWVNFDLRTDRNLERWNINFFSAYGDKSMSYNLAGLRARAGESQPVNNVIEA